MGVESDDGGGADVGVDAGCHESLAYDVVRPVRLAASRRWWQFMVAVKCLFIMASSEDCC